MMQMTQSANVLCFYVYAQSGMWCVSCGNDPMLRSYPTQQSAVDAACGAAADRSSFTGWETHVELGRCGEPGKRVGTFH